MPCCASGQVDAIIAAMPTEVTSAYICVQVPEELEPVRPFAEQYAQH